ncbi:MAG: hypothetical protein AB7W59_14155 [Acidimicrobiia bacterium]
MSNATALAVVPDDDINTSNDTEAAQPSVRQQISLTRGLRERVAAERDRIEAQLPKGRRRAVDFYLDLCVELGLRALAEVRPIEDPLAGFGVTPNETPWAAATAQG